MVVLDWLVDLLSGGRQRRLRRALSNLEAMFDPSTLEDEALDRAAGTYRRALRLALRVDPPQALSVFRKYDRRIPDDCYAPAFQRSGESWLSRLARRDDVATLTVVLELATRLGLDAVQREVSSQLAAVLGRDGDADQLVAHLLRCHQLGLLTADIAAGAVADHIKRSPLAWDAQLWSSFFGALPEPLLPPVFEVSIFLGRCADAVRLADTPVRRREALECCLGSQSLSDVEAGLQLARRVGDADAVRRLQEHAGDLLFASARYEEALEPYREAGRDDRVSECHERLGRPFEALAACPATLPDRLAALAGRCISSVDALVERWEFVEAARQAQRLARLGQAEAANLRGAVLAAGRRHFSRLAQHAALAGQPMVYGAWSRFEEEVGELGEAAVRAEDAGDRDRASRLFREAGRFGDAVRVLERDDSPEGRRRRAEARAEGGDLAGAAHLYEQLQQYEDAARLYQQAGEFHAAARCWRRCLGDEPIESEEMAECLRRGGAYRELVDLCVEAIQRKGQLTAAVSHLRRLLDAGVLSPDLAGAARSALDSLSARERRIFEGRLEAWAEQARREVDKRYARIWGLDLGTTMCSAAIYDTELQRPVLCLWKGRDQFASTLSLDAQGHELVGLAGEEIHGMVGHISGSKRHMGARKVWQIREQRYRPEEVAARLIRHARVLVEDFLAGAVRERIGELARAELEDVPEAWLREAEQRHDPRLARPRAVVTIPAYFHNNQKHATRDACTIAGVEAVRLIHEPTAACLAAARERRLDGRVVVVDLGAGTLDLSLLEVSEAFTLYDVRRVLGNNHYGGKDFDEVVTQALAAQLSEQGIDVPERGLPRRRLESAAEQLKIELSSQGHAELLLADLVDGKDAQLELDRAELEAMLASELEVLRDTCEEFRASLQEQPQRLVLVGGPMRSPLIRGRVEQAFGMSATGITDPHTAVVRGAALQAAVLDGALEKTILHDVVPLPLGVKAVDAQGCEHFSMLIDRNTRIPAKAKQIYYTAQDNQMAADIEVFQGQLDAQSKVGHIRLDGLWPAKKGQAQIEVRFEIDANCVLQVTARDTQMGRSASVTLTDTTLLPPSERDRVAQRFERQREHESLRRRLALQVADAAGIDTEALRQEWRGRLGACDPSAVPPALDHATQRALVEMLNGGDEVEDQLLRAELALRDLAGEAREHLERPIDPGASLTAGQELADELERRLGALRQPRERLAAWNAILTRLATAQTDALRRFRAFGEAGDYSRALEAQASLPRPLGHLPDVHMLLNCLAQVGDAAGYRRALLDHAELLRAVPANPAGPFLAQARPALARVQAGPAQGSGFLVSDRLLVANQRGLAGPIATAQVEVRLREGRRRVQEIVLPPSPHHDVAVLRLAEPATAPPLRIGYPSLVRIGDPVYAIGSALDPAAMLLAGVVDKFELFPEQNLRLLKVGLRVPISSLQSGGPLLNDLGEVVGILTIREEAPGDVCFALTADSLAPLLARAGHPARASGGLVAGEC